MYIYICIYIYIYMSAEAVGAKPFLGYPHLLDTLCASDIFLSKSIHSSSIQIVPNCNVCLQKQFSRPNWLKQITKQMCGENITMLTYYDTCICIHIYILYNIHQYSIDNYIAALGTTQPTLEEDLVEPC